MVGQLDMILCEHRCAQRSATLPIGTFVWDEPREPGIHLGKTYCQPCAAPRLIEAKASGQGFDVMGAVDL